MNLPNLPTDNLYKFVALAGVASFLAGHWLILEARSRGQDLVAQEWQASVDRMLTESVQLGDRVLKEHDNEEDQRKSMQNLQPMVELRQWLERGKVLNRIQEIQTETKSQIDMLNILKWFGYISAPLGFLLWWLKVQRYQDAVLKAEYLKTCHPVPKPPKRRS